MRNRILSALFVLTAAACQGCVTWSASVDREEPGYREFFVEGKSGTVGVAAFSCETGLTRNSWARRKVFLAVTGPLLGIIPWPWDLRLIWSPPEIEDGWSSPMEAFDEALSASAAARLEKYGFKGVPIDPRKQEGPLADLPSLLKAASDAGCGALYVVWYNEFTRLEYRTEVRREKDSLYHRLKTLQGSALIPSVALYRLPAGSRMLARSNTALRGNGYLDHFWGPIFAFGRQTPLDQSGAFVERFIKEVSGRTIFEARERCADFLARRDFTPPPTEKPPAEAPPKDPPPDKPPTEQPPAEQPPARTPPPEQPEGETPPGERPEGGGRG